MATSSKPFVVEFKIEDPTRIQSYVRIGTPISKDDATGKLRLTTWDTDFTAIWDTGAPFTLVVPRVVQTASLKQRGFRMVGGIGSAPKQRPAYPASLLFLAPNSLSLQFVDVTMLEDDSQLGGADMLIGMDIIAKGETRIGRKNGELWFSFTLEQDHGR